MVLLREWGAGMGSLSCRDAKLGSTPHTRARALDAQVYVADTVVLTARVYPALEASLGVAAIGGEAFANCTMWNMASVFV